MRKLASVQRIENLRDIEGADKIEVCTLCDLGWEVVVRKEEQYKVEDLVVYCEYDCVMPEKPEFEFLRERKFRIRIIRLKKQISQGIVFPLSILPPNVKVIEGLDVTEILGIKKFDPQLQEEKALAEQARSKSKINKFLMQFALYRFIYFKINYKDKGWPRWISKTDEERCISGKTLIITDKGKKSIEEICKNRLKIKVLTYNVETQKNEFCKILDFNIKENKNKKWLKITTFNDGFLIITDDHRVYNPTLKCYRMAKNLNINDDVLSFE